jgi:CheY-like chemotaxis protein
MRTLLIVEDQTELAAMLAATAEALGLTPLVAVNGRDALALVDRRPPQAALVDLLLPDMRGQDLVRQLSARSIACIAMSGVVRGERIAREAVEAGAIAFVEKPFDAREVMEGLFNHLSPSNGNGDPAVEAEALQDLLPMEEPGAGAAAPEEIISAAQTTGIFAPAPPAGAGGGEPTPLPSLAPAPPPDDLEPSESDLSSLQPLQAVDAQHFGAESPAGAEPAIPEDLASEHSDLAEAAPSATGMAELDAGSALPFDGEAEYLDLSDLTVLEVGDLRSESNGAEDSSAPQAAEGTWNGDEALTQPPQGAEPYQDAPLGQDPADGRPFEPSADRAVVDETFAALSPLSPMTPPNPAGDPQEARDPDGPPTLRPALALTPGPGDVTLSEAESVDGQLAPEAKRDTDPEFAEPGLAPDETAVVDIEPLSVPQDPLAAATEPEARPAPADAGEPAQAPATDELCYIAQPADSPYLGRLPDIAAPPSFPGELTRAESPADEIVEIDPADVQPDLEPEPEPSEFAALGVLAAPAELAAPPGLAFALEIEPAPVVAPSPMAPPPQAVAAPVAAHPMEAPALATEPAPLAAPPPIAAPSQAVAALPMVPDLPVVAPALATEPAPWVAPPPIATPAEVATPPVVPAAPVVAPDLATEPAPWVAPPPIATPTEAATPPMIPAAPVAASDLATEPAPWVAPPPIATPAEVATPPMIPATPVAASDLATEPAAVIAPPPMAAPTPLTAPPMFPGAPSVAAEPATELAPVTAPPPPVGVPPPVAPPPAVAAPAHASPPQPGWAKQSALRPETLAAEPATPPGPITSVRAGRRQKDLRLPLLGSLSERPVAALLAALHHCRQTGELRIRHAEVVKVVAVHEGRPVFAASNVLAERLARFVLRSGRLSRDQLARVREEAARTSQRTGDAMVALGLLSPAELRALVAQQVREIIWSALDWTEGSYQIVLRRNPRKDLLAIALEPTGPLLLEGFRRSTSLIRLRQLVPSDARFESDSNPPFDPYELQLSTEEALVLSHADATKAVEDLILLSALEERAVLAVLHALVQTGVLRRCPKTASRSRVVLV